MRKGQVLLCLFSGTRPTTRTGRGHSGDHVRLEKLSSQLARGTGKVHSTRILEWHVLLEARSWKPPAHRAFWMASPCHPHRPCSPVAISARLTHLACRDSQPRPLASVTQHNPMATVLHLETQKHLRYTVGAVFSPMALSKLLVNRDDPELTCPPPRR